MSKDTIAGIRQSLDEAASALRVEDDPQAFARQLVLLIGRLEQGAVTLLSVPAAATTSPEEELYYRAVGDFESLQKNLAYVRSVLSDRELLIKTLQGSGHDVENTQRHLSIIGALDQSLQDLVSLMQYDTPKRTEIDVRQGFQLSSGSVNYGRFYFAPPKENSGN
jgi:hypothetical protein